MLQDLARFVGEHPLGVVLAVLLALGWRFRKRWRRPRQAVEQVKSSPPHPNVLKLQSLLSEYEQKIGEPRPKGLTVLEWAATGTEGQAFLVAYSEARYSQEVPGEEDIKKVAALLSQVRQPVDKESS